MKYDSLKAFHKHLLSAAPSHFSSAYLVLSHEDFILKEGLKYLVSALGQVDSVTCSGSTPGLLNELSSMTLFQKRKLTVVEGPEEISKKEQELVINWIKKPVQESFLVFVSEGLKRNSVLYKAVEKYGIILDVPEAKPWQKEKEALSFVHEQISGVFKKKIDERAAILLVEYIGTDKRALMSELEKLAIYAIDQPMITVSDVSALCRIVPKENVFKLSEALLMRDGKRAVSLLLSLQHEGVQPLALLRLLRQQFEVDLQVALLCRQGQEEEISNLYPYMKGFILQQHKKQAESYGIASFKKGLVAIDESEVRIKSMNVEPDILIAALIGKLCVV